MMAALHWLTASEVSSAHTGVRGEEPMRRMNRREFAKIAGGAALGVPLLPSVAPAFRPALTSPHAPLPQAPAQNEPPKPEPKLKLTEKQEEAVKQALERRERQLAGMRSRVLPYDLEPAFVFEVRRHPRAASKGA